MVTWRTYTFVALIWADALVSVSGDYRSEIKILPGHKVFNDYSLALPHTYIQEYELPDSFTWGDVDGKSYLTHSLNQHLPQYCGSCWAHGTASALADRIKIARDGQGEDINLSIQFILNCGAHIAGSCYGGYSSGAYELIKSKGYIPYDTCQPYTACSSDSAEGFCKYDTAKNKCEPQNICKTCNTFQSNGGYCTEIDKFPNATIAEYGVINYNVHAIKSEIFSRGPVAASINAEPILNYRGGIVTDHDDMDKNTNHVVSIVGWGMEEETGTQYWIVRNSWGQYWGEMGYVRVELGYNAIGIESYVVWATPGTFTLSNYPCGEGGEYCSAESHEYVDPFHDIASVKRRLAEARRK